jgi:hypothetical protein
MNKFLKDHGKHLWMGVITLILLPLCVKFQLFDLHNVGAFFRVFLATIISAATGYCIEWYQAVFYNANKGEKGISFWNQHWVKDVMVTTIAGFLGAVIGEIVFI